MASSAKAQRSVPYLIRESGAESGQPEAATPSVGEADQGSEALVEQPEEEGRLQREPHGVREKQPVETHEEIREPASGEASAPVETPAPTVGGRPPGYFYELWERRRQALLRQDVETADKRLADLLQAKRVAGWPDVFAFADALVWESQQALGTRRAAVLAEAATMMAPHRPATHAALARALWASEGGVGPALRAYVKSLGTALREPPLLWTRLSWGLWLLIGSFWAAAACFACACVLRYGPVFVHDLTHVFVRPSWAGFAVVVGVAAFAAPVLLWVGPVWTVAFWIALLGVHYSRVDRATAVLVLAIFAVGGAGLPLLTKILAYPGSRAADVYVAARDMGGREAAKRLAVREHLGGEELGVLGLRAMWSGDLATAEKWLTKAIQIRPRSSSAHALLAQVHHEGGDIPEALKALEQAVAVDPNNVVALFNLSRLHYALTQNDEARKIHQRAVAVDAQAVAALGRQATNKGRNALAGVPVPRAWLAVSPGYRDGYSRAVAALWGYAGGDLPRELFAYVTAALAALLVALGLLHRRLEPAIRCWRCGKPACRRCAGMLGLGPEAAGTESEALAGRAAPIGNECPQCYAGFCGGRETDEQLRADKESEAGRYQSRVATVRLALGVMSAGLGHLAGGSSLKGVALLTGFWTAVGCVLVGLDVWSLPTWTRSADHHQVLALGCGSAAALLLHGVAWWDSRRRRFRRSAVVRR